MCRTIGWTIAIILICVSVLYRKPLMAKFATLYYQHRCLRYIGQSGRPVFIMASKEELAKCASNDPELSLPKDRFHLLDRGGRVALCWKQLRNAANISGFYTPEGLLFLGELKTSSNVRKLVAVELRYQGKTGLEFDVFVIEPASLVSAIQESHSVDAANFNAHDDDPFYGLNVTGVWIGWLNQGVRIYPGRVSDRDPAVFEAKAMIGPWEDTIIGRLNNDGTLSLTTKGTNNKQIIEGSGFETNWKF